jgi:hypothetical protein
MPTQFDCFCCAGLELSINRRLFVVILSSSRCGDKGTIHGSLVLPINSLHLDFDRGLLKGHVPSFEFLCV